PIPTPARPTVLPSPTRNRPARSPARRRPARIPPPFRTRSRVVLCPAPHTPRGTTRTATIPPTTPTTPTSSAITTTTSTTRNTRQAMDDLNNLLGIRNVSPVLAPPKQIEVLLAKAYSGEKEESIFGIIQALEATDIGANSVGRENSIDLDDLQELANSAPVRK